MNHSRLLLSDVAARCGELVLVCEHGGEYTGMHSHNTGSPSGPHLVHQTPTCACEAHLPAVASLSAPGLTRSVQQQ